LIFSGRSFIFRHVLSAGCHGGADGFANANGYGCGWISVGLLKTLCKSNLIFEISNLVL
jgi:hypothetical protein